MANIEKNKPQTQVADVQNGNALQTTKKVFKIIGTVIFRLRKIFMAIPVVYAALRLADYCRENLPEMVGLDIQASGEFAHLIEREQAIEGCLVITGACLVMMLFSRRSVYPWIISIFTLILPVLLLMVNYFHG